LKSVGQVYADDYDSGLSIKCMSKVTIGSFRQECRFIKGHLQLRYLHRYKQVVLDEYR